LTKKKIVFCSHLVFVVDNFELSLTRCVGFRFSQEYFGLSGSLGERIFDMVTQHRKDDKMTFEDLVIAKVYSSLFILLIIWFLLLSF
jgi:hypothetical protein